MRRVSRGGLAIVLANHTSSSDTKRRRRRDSAPVSMPVIEVGRASLFVLLLASLIIAFLP